MSVWQYNWELLDVALLCLALGFAVRYWLRRSDRRRREAEDRLERLRTL
jgi:type VI protein secretion system component VasF